MMQEFAFLIFVASVVLLSIPRGAKLMHIGTYHRHRDLFCGTVGGLRVQYKNGTFAGHVSNVPTGPIGLNTGYNAPWPYQLLVRVSFANNVLYAKAAAFSPPYIGGSGSDILTDQNLATIQFTNVAVGQDFNIWDLDLKTGLLKATWSNSDGTQVTPTLMFDTVANILSFTANPTGVSEAQPSILPVVQVPDISAKFDPPRLITAL